MDFYEELKQQYAFLDHHAFDIISSAAGDEQESIPARACPSKVVQQLRAFMDRS